MSDQQLGLFGSAGPRPLAHRLRPSCMQQFVGQQAILDKIDLLDNNQLPHIILHGPPGCGKTTLAHLIALRADAMIFPFNAVLGGLKELREIIKEASTQQEKTPVIFIDEIHRFNKAQQDALLPYLENGEFCLLGATTENPRTSLNRAILSRVQTWRLKALKDEEIEEILRNACRQLSLTPPQELITYLAQHSNGDARTSLNQLEILHQNKQLLAEDSIDNIKRHLWQENRLYDKNSDRHFDVISAFIKSIRGSDVDATLLWLAVMLDGGEDIEFIGRRLIILASEDIGNADPRALQIASSAHYAIKNIGMPEARIILSQASIYLAHAPKSNACYQAIDRALAYVRKQPTLQVPNHLRNHHPQKKNYRYPHENPKHWIQQDYGANKLQFYQDDQQGYEKLQHDFQRKNRS